MPTLLLTGGAGFIGSQLARTLTQAGFTVRVLDLLTYAGRREHVDGVPCELVVGDVCDPGLVADAVDGCQVVVHAAAESDVSRSLHGGAACVRTNVEGTRVVLDAAAHAGVEHFLLLSTDEVLGEVLGGPAPGPDAPLRPGNPYAASKAGAEALVHAWHKSFDLSTAIVRCVNAYGPRQHPEKAVPWWAQDALRGRIVPVQGLGTAVRDWIYVEDLARGIARALERWQSGAIWHFAAHDQQRNLAMARRVLAACAVHTGRLAQIEFVEDRRGQDRRYALDDSATRRALDWAPSVDLEQGLARTVAWIQQKGLALWS
ncbi:MAG: NAD-dependent epimerase/dehydratase family protein [Oligoflexia bacterium]|nr:NAD-dependent epimerase/dehydratase family protein [Oligoflexia bacterium]